MSTPPSGNGSAAVRRLAHTVVSVAGTVAGWGRRAISTLLPGPPEEEGNRWRTVTVNLPPGELQHSGGYPEPLAALGDLVELRVAPAPGGKGTELGARLRQQEPHGSKALAGMGSEDDPRHRVRVALRDAKALLETGEVLRSDPRPHGKRPATPLGVLVDEWEKKSKGEGIL
jgi:hypothetical protein